MSPTPRTPIRGASNLPDSPMCLTPLNSQRLNWDVDSPISDSSPYSDSSDIYNRISDVTYNYEKRSDVRRRLPKPTQSRRGLTELYKFPKQAKKEDTKKLQELKKRIQIEEFCDTVLKLCKESDDEADDIQVKENMKPDRESKKSEECSSEESFVTAPNNNNDLFDDSANDHLILASQQVEHKLSPEQEPRPIPLEVKEITKTDSSLSAIFEDSFDVGDLLDDIKQTEIDRNSNVISKGSPPELKTQKSQKTPFQRYSSMPSTSLKQESAIEEMPLKKHTSSSSVNSSSTTSISSLSSASSTGSLLSGKCNGFFYLSTSFYPFTVL